MRTLALTATALFALIASAPAESAGKGDGARQNANGEVNSRAKFDRELIKNIETEDDYWGAVDSNLHFGVGALELEAQGYNVDWDHVQQKWDKNWDRLDRAADDIFDN